MASASLVSRSPVTPHVRTQVRWNRLPILSVVVACGLWMAVLSYIASRDNLAWAMGVFWVGLLLMYVPVVGRLWQLGIPRQEAIALVLVLGFGLYLASVLRYPLYFASYDELLHLRTADDIIQTQRLFTSNSLLPVSPLFPGLEIATTALGSVSGLGIFESGVIIIGSARLMLLLALYLIFERLGGSVRLASLATVVYMGSSTFMFFDTSFAYESLGLPVAMVLLHMLSRRSSATLRERWIWNILIILTILAVVIIHHATAYILALFLCFWSLVVWYTNKSGARELNPIWMTFLLLGWNLVWLFSIASITVDYLGPYVTDALLSLQQLLSGQGGNRQLLTVVGKQGTIDLERIIAFASVACIMIGLSLGLWQWWCKQRGHGLSIALAICSLAYPAIPLLRLNSSSWQFSNRLAGFLFVAIGFIIALGLTELELPDRWARARSWLGVPMLVIIFLGGIAAGSSSATRLPGSYAIVADERSIEAQGIMAAEWARSKLGQNNRMAGDRIQTILMGSNGRQRMITHGSDNVSISGIFLKYRLDEDDYAIIKRTGIRYLVVDQRVTTGLPHYGYYFENWEQQIVSFVSPVNIGMLDKFDHMPTVSRIFDSGSIVVYDIRVPADAP